jgi:superfamily II DNA or RNA helicase
LDRARQGEVPVLIATQLLDEGVDIPCLSRVFLAWPSKARGRTIQRVGRVMRPHPDKPDARVIDVVDRRVAPLARQAARRATLYRQVLGATPTPLPAPGA